LFFSEKAAMPFDPQTPPTATAADLPAPAKPQPPRHETASAQPEPSQEWKNTHREWLPYWQQSDPVPPEPAEAPALETPGDALTERQEAFCRAYVECPVGAKAAVAAGYSPACARKQASRLLKHPLVIRRIHDLRDVRGKDHQVRRDTLIDQAEAVFEASMERGEFYAAMQALTMKARLAGFADYLPGVRVLRQPARDVEQQFWARAHAAEQRILAARLGEIAGASPPGGAPPGAPLAGPALEAVREARDDAAMYADCAEAAADDLATSRAGAAERRARKRRRWVR
jgi:hypothetical protein